MAQPSEPEEIDLNFVTNWNTSTTTNFASNYPPVDNHDSPLNLFDELGIDPGLNEGFEAQNFETIAEENNMQIDLDDFFDQRANPDFDRLNSALETQDQDFFFDINLGFQVPYTEPIEQSLPVESIPQTLDTIQEQGAEILTNAQLLQIIQSFDVPTGKEQKIFEAKLINFFNEPKNYPENGRVPICVSNNDEIVFLTSINGDFQTFYTDSELCGDSDSAVSNDIQNLSAETRLEIDRTFKHFMGEMFPEELFRQLYGSEEEILDYTKKMLLENVNWGAALFACVITDSNDYSQALQNMAQRFGEYIALWTAWLTKQLNFIGYPSNDKIVRLANDEGEIEPWFYKIRLVSQSYVWLKYVFDNIFVFVVEKILEEFPESKRVVVKLDAYDASSLGGELCRVIDVILHFYQSGMLGGYVVGSRHLMVPTLASEKAYAKLFEIATTLGDNTVRQLIADDAKPEERGEKRQFQPAGTNVSAESGDLYLPLAKREQGKNEIRATSLFELRNQMSSLLNTRNRVLYALWLSGGFVNGDILVDMRDDRGENGSSSEVFVLPQTKINIKFSDWIAHGMNIYHQEVDQLDSTFYRWLSLNEWPASAISKDLISDFGLEFLEGVAVEYGYQDMFRSNMQLSKRFVIYALYTHPYLDIEYAKYVAYQEGTSWNQVNPEQLRFSLIGNSQEKQRKKAAAPAQITENARIMQVAQQMPSWNLSENQVIDIAQESTLVREIESFNRIYARNWLNSDLLISQKRENTLARYVGKPLTNEPVESNNNLTASMLMCLLQLPDTHDWLQNFSRRVRELLSFSIEKSSTEFVYLEYSDSTNSVQENSRRDVSYRAQLDALLSRQRYFPYKPMRWLVESDFQDISGLGNDYSIYSSPQECIETLREYFQKQTNPELYVGEERVTRKTGDKIRSFDRRSRQQNDNSQKEAPFGSLFVVPDDYLQSRGSQLISLVAAMIKGIPRAFVQNYLTTMLIVWGNTRYHPETIMTMVEGLDTLFDARSLTELYNVVFLQDTSPRINTKYILEQVESRYNYIDDSLKSKIVWLIPMLRRISSNDPPHGEKQGLVRKINKFGGIWPIKKQNRIPDFRVWQKSIRGVPGKEALKNISETGVDHPIDNNFSHLLENLTDIDSKSEVQLISIGETDLVIAPKTPAAPNVNIVIRKFEQSNREDFQLITNAIAKIKQILAGNVAEQKRRKFENDLDRLKAFI